MQFTNFELGTRIPLIISLPPSMHPSQGSVSAALVEELDIFPTLLEVAGLPPPPQRLHGASLLPLLHDPARLAHKANASFSQYPRQVDGRSYMGMTMRTADWRFTEWCGFNYTRAYPVWDEADAFGCQLELYPHEGDDGKNMDLFENVPLRQTFPLILAPFRSTDLFGAGKRGLPACEQGARRGTA